jgi:phosphoglycolate phosphatase-like HAD superfamily hydrolase
MSFFHPTILALDFDGVICNGMAEYLATSWQTYNRIWQPETREMPIDLSDRFSRLRPLIETGWEMPVLIRALLTGISETKVVQDWSLVRQHILEEDNLNPLQIGGILDGLRDEWIVCDRQSWLQLHEFYPHIIDKLKSLINSSTKLIIITTKEARFVLELLAKENLNLPPENVFGKEQKCPKSVTLTNLIRHNPQEAIAFVEDRWNTLKQIAANPDLNSVKLYLADWGYNTEIERQLAQTDPRIKLISLADFERDFS